MSPSAAAPSTDWLHTVVYLRKARMDEKGIMKDLDCRQICASSLGFEWSVVERLVVLSSPDERGLSGVVRTEWMGEDYRPNIPPPMPLVSNVAEVHTGLGGI